MALLTSPIPRVAVGEIIEESWGDSVAQSLNNLTELQDWIVWSPGSGTEFFADNDGLMVEWFKVGGASPIEIYVPDWATSAYAHFQINGIQYDPASTTARTTYLLQATFGTLEGRQIRLSGQGGWFGASWADRFPNVEDIAAGDRKVTIKAQRLEGTTGSAGPPVVEASRWKLFDQSDFAMFVMFSRAINFYPAL